MSDYSDDDCSISDADSHYTSNPESDFSCSSISDEEIFEETDEEGEKYILRKFSSGKIETIEAPDSLYYSLPNIQHKKIKYLYKKHKEGKNLTTVYDEILNEKKPKEEAKEEEKRTNYSLIDKKGLEIELKIVEESDLPTKFGYVEIKKSPPYFKKLTREEKIRRLENLIDEFIKNERPKEEPPKTEYTGINEIDSKWVNDTTKSKITNKKDKESKITPLPPNLLGEEEDLTKKTKKELIEKAQNSGVKRLTKKTKKELIEIIKPSNIEEDLTKKTKKELIEIAKKSGVKGLINKTKKELIEIIGGNIKKKEYIVFTSENERKMFPSYNKAAKEMKISSSQINYKMGASKIIDGVEWKITKEYA